MSSGPKPFLKWAGGKRWLSRAYPEFFHVKFSRLVEPFAGSAAVFFRLNPRRVWLNDVNRELINTYKQIKINWEAVYKLLQEYQIAHSAQFYYLMRDTTPLNAKHRAARFIYLNRTCFNGIYRVNLKGRFNVPIGTKTAVIMPDDDFRAIADLLRSARLTSFDFEQVIDRCGPSDLVFADPPYTVRHNLNGFVKYNELLFSWADQVRLREAVFRASDRGAQVIVSNADHESVRDLYSEGHYVHRVERHSVIAGNAKMRKATTELLIRL